VARIVTNTGTESGSVLYYQHPRVNYSGILHAVSQSRNHSPAKCSHQWVLEERKARDVPSGPAQETSLDMLNAA